MSSNDEPNAESLQNDDADRRSEPADADRALGTDADRPEGPASATRPSGPATEASRAGDAPTRNRSSDGASRPSGRGDDHRRSDGDAVGRPPTRPAGVHPRPHRIDLAARTAGTAVRIEASGDIAAARFAPDEGAACADGVAHATFRAGDGRRRFRFSGESLDVAVLRGAVDATLSLAATGAATRRDGTRLTVHAQGADVAYRFVTSGPVRSENDGASRVAAAGEPVTGRVAGSGVDAYRVTGDVTEFRTSSDDVIVMLDGEVVDPTALGSQ